MLRDLWPGLLMLALGAALLLAPFIASRRITRNDAPAPAGEQESREHHAPELRATARDAGRPLTGGTVYGKPAAVNPGELATAAVDEPAAPAIGRVHTTPHDPGYRSRHGTSDVDEPVAPAVDSDEARPTAAGVNLWFAGHVAQTCGWSAR